MTLKTLIDLGRSYETAPEDTAAAARLRAAAESCGDVETLAEAASHFPMALHVAEILAGRALALAPEHERAQEALATARYLNDGQFLEPTTSEAVLQFATKCPDSLRALRLLAILHRERKNEEAWVQTAERMLAVDSLSADGHAILATVRAEHGDEPGAVRLIRDYISAAEHDQQRYDDVQRMRARLAAFESGDTQALWG